MEGQIVGESKEGRMLRAVKHLFSYIAQQHQGGRDVFSYSLPKDRLWNLLHLKYLRVQNSKCFLSGNRYIFFLAQLLVCRALHPLTVPFYVCKFLLLKMQFRCGYADHLTSRLSSEGIWYHLPVEGDTKIFWVFAEVLQQCVCRNEAQRAPSTIALPAYLPSLPSACSKLSCSL